MKHHKLIALLQSCTGERVKRAELITAAKNLGININQTLPAFRVPGAATSRGVYSVSKMLNAMESGFAAGKCGRKPDAWPSPRMSHISAAVGISGVLAPTRNDIDDELKIMGVNLERV